MRLVVGDRQSGKTTYLLRWLAEGHPLSEPPFWSRAVVVQSVRMQRHLADRVRRSGWFSRGLLPGETLPVFTPWWLDESRGLSRDLEIAVDDADLLAQPLAPPFQRVTVMTMTAEEVVLLGGKVTAPAPTPLVNP